MESKSVDKRTDSLTFKFSIIFTIFTVFTLLMSGINTYINQTNAYKIQYEQDIVHISTHLKSLIESDGDNFAIYQNYIIEHSDEIIIPPDFDDWRTAKNKFDLEFAKTYPEKVYGIDVQFDDMTDELKNLYITYYHEYWILIFEKTREDFDIPYTYYIYPTGKGEHIIYIIDIERYEKETENGTKLYICKDVEEDLSSMPKLTETWIKGSAVKGVDVFDNEFGYTYSYYMPLIINGAKMGLVCADMDVSSIDKNVISNTFKLVGSLGVILIISVVFLLYFIHKHYISKLAYLNKSVKDYTKDKDSHIAEKIEQDIDGHDEISVLSRQIASMITELQNHIENIIKISGELTKSKEYADELNELAQTDALTGLGNKMAYNLALKRLDVNIRMGTAVFGIAMIDLNYLKKINDNYGHEKGDIAIKNLSELILKIFPQSKAFRIGGDEFVVIVEGNAYNQIAHLLDDFNKALAENKSENSWEHISAAIGYARYMKNIDENANMVFRRADHEMYENKKAMKAVRVD